eukprot:253668-Rhodomonas_salina.1
MNCDTCPPLCPSYLPSLLQPLSRHQGSTTRFWFAIRDQNSGFLCLFRSADARRKRSESTPSLLLLLRLHQPHLSCSALVLLLHQRQRGPALLRRTFRSRCALNNLRSSWGARSRSGSGAGVGRELGAGAGAGAASFAGDLLQPVGPALHTEHAVEDCPDKKESKQSRCRVCDFSQTCLIVGGLAPVQVPCFPCKRDEVDGEHVQGVVRPVRACETANNYDTELIHEESSPAGVFRATGSDRTHVREEQHCYKHSMRSSKCIAQYERGCPRAEQSAPDLST